MIPATLGHSLADVLQAWQTADPGPGCRMVGWAVGLGRYDFYQGRLCRLLTGNGVATYRPATAGEQADVLAAIAAGTFQIEAQPVIGIVGGQGGAGTIAGASWPTIIFHQATGRPV